MNTALIFKKSVQLYAFWYVCAAHGSGTLKVLEMKQTRGSYFERNLSLSICICWERQPYTME